MYHIHPIAIQISIPITIFTIFLLDEMKVLIDSFLPVFLRQADNMIMKMNRVEQSIQAYMDIRLDWYM